MAEEWQFIGEDPGRAEGQNRLGLGGRVYCDCLSRFGHARLQRKENLPMLSGSEEIGRQGASLRHRGERHRRDEGILLGVHGKGGIGLDRHHRSYASGSVLVDLLH